jgi:hypothetical protein
MLFKDNWLTTNVSKNPVDPFQVRYKTSKSDIHKPFTVAAEETILDIEKLVRRHLGKRPYLSLSGGSDSMYILRLCARLKISITPVIVRISDNLVVSYDTDNAITECKNLGYVPAIVDLTEEQHFKIYCDNFVPILGVSSQSVQQLLVARYVASKNGIVVNGVGVILRNEAGSGARLGVMENDFCTDVLLEEDIVCPFFIYSPQMVLSTLTSIPNDYYRLPVCYLKSLLYGTYMVKTPALYTNPNIQAEFCNVQAPFLSRQFYAPLEDRNWMISQLS